MARRRMDNERREGEGERGEEGGQEKKTKESTRQGCMGMRYRGREGHKMGKSIGGRIRPRRATGSCLSRDSLKASIRPAYSLVG